MDLRQLRKSKLKYVGTDNRLRFRKGNHIQSNPVITDTVGTRKSVRITECPYKAG